MATELKGMRVGGDGETVEVDGAYFGGYIKPANRKENRRDRRLAEEPDRQAPGRGRGARAWRPHPAGRVQVGSGCAWDGSCPVAPGTQHHGRRSRRHGTTCMPATTCRGSTMAKPRASRAASTRTARKSSSAGMRRAEIGHHHHIAGAYLVRYAQESAWREDHRRALNGSQVRGVMTLAMAAPISVDWSGYWQRGPAAQRRA